jgi:IS5 family transposase
MGKQRTFAGLAWSAKGKVTRRERFLGEMNAVIPWQRLMKLIEPYYPKSGRGRQPLGLEKMLRIYFVQQWFDLSDPGAEDAIYDSESIRRFVGVELGEDRVPDESTILRFRHLLEKHDLTEAIFAEVRSLLEEKDLLLKTGTIMDATIISAPSSTKNREQKRDPEMRQTKKGNTWFFGMKVHVGTDTQGLTHSLKVTDAAQADIKQVPDLLHGAERALYGDRAYWSKGLKQDCRRRKVRYRVNRRGGAKQPLSEGWRKINQSRSQVRARVEHPFHVVKRLWGFGKVRYRGLAKNEARAHTMFALANLYLVRKRLIPPGATCAL